MDAVSKTYADVPLGGSIFPVLSDNQNNGDTRSQIVNIDEATVSAASTFCKENGIELRYLLATAWATLLARFGDSEEVHFGVFDDGSQTGEYRKWGKDRNNNHFYKKSCMQLATVLMREDMTIGRMLRPNTWSFNDTSPQIYGSFNTGICLLKNQESTDISDVVEVVDETQART